jgi:hypothetical protein
MRPLQAHCHRGLGPLYAIQKERYELTTFHKVDRDGGGALYLPVACGVHDRVQARPCTRYGALWHYYIPTLHFHGAHRGPTR